MWKCSAREEGSGSEGRREKEEVKVRKREREIRILAQHSLLITWFVLASPLILVLSICPHSPLERNPEINPDIYTHCGEKPRRYMEL